MLSHKPLRPPMSHSLNESKSAPVPRGKVPVPKSAMDVTAESTRPCTCCKKPISMAQPYVWCEPCRLKERERSRQKVERKRAGVSTSQAKMMGEAEKGDASSSNPPAGVKRAFAIAEMKSKAKIDLLAASPGMRLFASIKDSPGDTSARLKPESAALKVKKSRTVSTGTKRGFALLEESADDTSARLKHEFASAQKKKAKISHPAKSALAGRKRPLASLGPNSDEYQTSKMLYDSLVSCVAAATSAGSLLQFNGCYAIVSTGIPAVSVQRRAEIVARELRERLKACQHHAFNQSAPVLRNDSVLSSAHIFDCLCFGSSSPNMTSQDNKTGIARFLKGSESYPASAGSAAGASSCNGKIKITVEDDFSHPMGIKGHKISIDMEH